MPRGCSVCALPPAVRRDCEDRLRRRGLSLRAVAAYATDLGHPVNKDSLSAHLARHVGPDADDAPVATASADLVALAAYDTLGGRPSIRRQLAERLHQDGLHQQAEIVAADLAGDLPGTLEALRGTEVAAVFDGRVIAAAVGAVLPAHKVVCLQVSDELESLGAAEVYSYGRELLVTEQVILANTDSNGRCRLLELLDDEEGQRRKCAGRVAVRRGPWPQGVSRLEPGSARWVEARDAAFAAAHNLGDPNEQAQALRKARSDWGDRPTSRTLAEYRTAR